MNAYLLALDDAGIVFEAVEIVLELVENAISNVATVTLLFVRCETALKRTVFCLRSSQIKKSSYVFRTE